MSLLAKKRCVPCEEGGDPLPEEKARELLKELDGWMLIDGGGLLAKTFEFSNYQETIKFVNKVAIIADEEGHHPDMTVSYDHVGVELMTHAVGGLTENDFILAAKINEIT
jgi:4a-hydroxytetrahydrobiopterin dehydratase